MQVSAYLDGPCVTIARLPSAHWIITGGFWDGAVLATAAAPGVATKLLLTKETQNPLIPAVLSPLLMRTERIWRSAMQAAY